MTYGNKLGKYEIFGKTGLFSGEWWGGGDVKLNIAMCEEFLWHLDT
jgi:hypothetical protein